MRGKRPIRPNGSTPTSFFPRRHTSTRRNEPDFQKKYNQFLELYSNLNIGALRTMLRQKRAIQTEFINHPQKNDPDLAIQVSALRSLIHPQLTAVVTLNRGLIAAKIGAVARAIDLHNILVCHESDKSSPAAQMADDVFFVKNPVDLQEIGRTLGQIKNHLPYNYRIGIHPGYGYLSENPELPKLCEELGLIFVGPNATSMYKFSDKGNARKIARQVQVPVVPGYDDTKNDQTKLMKAAKQIGFPVMIKTTDGGGGTGNRVINNSIELEQMLASVFKDKSVILERFLTNPHHYEMQVFIDKNEVVLFGSRDCSYQRNYQKVLEMAPANTPHLSNMERHALKLGEEARRNGYRGAVTVEFLLQNNDLFFNECNTRIQVEHPPTEQIHGNVIKFVELQLHIAAGGTIRDFLISKLNDDNTSSSMLTQDIISQMRSRSAIKCSIEMRVNAVDFQIYENKLFHTPTKGTITNLKIPSASVRGIVENAVAQDNEIDTTEVNPTIMLACGTGSNQKEALINLRWLLDEIDITGVPTNLPYLKFVINHLEQSGFTPTVKTSQEVDQCFINAQTLEVQMRPTGFW